jgi:hypothetical protein
MSTISRNCLFIYGIQKMGEGFFPFILLLSLPCVLDESGRYPMKHLKELYLPHTCVWERGYHLYRAQFIVKTVGSTNL